MAVDSLDKILDSFGNGCQSFPFIKKTTISGSVAGFPMSLWTVNGQPGPGLVPTTPVALNSASQGALKLQVPSGGKKLHLAGSSIHLGALQSFEIHDRLAHMAGLNATLTTAQTVGLNLHSSGLGATENLAERIVKSDFSVVQWWLEIYSDIGSTSRTFTFTYTTDTGVTGQTTALSYTGAASNNARMFPINPGDTHVGIRSIDSVQLSGTTGTAGNFGVTATIQRAELKVPLVQQIDMMDWTSHNLPIIYDNSCLFFMSLANTTTVQPPRGVLTFIEG